MNLPRFALLAVIPCLVLLGCGPGQADRTLATPYAPDKGTLVKPTPTDPKVPKATQPATTTKATEKSTDEKANKLKKTDEEVIELLRKKEIGAALEKLKGVAKEYQRAKVEDCTVTESLSVAVAYVRILALLGKDFGEESIAKYVASARLFSSRGGIPELRFDAWFEGIVIETLAVVGKQ